MNELILSIVISNVGNDLFYWPVTENALPDAAAFKNQTKRKETNLHSFAG